MVVFQHLVALPGHGRIDAVVLRTPWFDTFAQHDRIRFFWDRDAFAEVITTALWAEKWPRWKQQQLQWQQKQVEATRVSSSEWRGSTIAKDNHQFCQRFYIACFIDWWRVNMLLFQAPTMRWIGIRAAPPALPECRSNASPLLGRVSCTWCSVPDCWRNLRWPTVCPMIDWHRQFSL